MWSAFGLEEGDISAVGEGIDNCKVMKVVEPVMQSDAVFESVLTGCEIERTRESSPVTNNATLLLNTDNPSPHASCEINSNAFSLHGDANSNAIIDESIEEVGVEFAFNVESTSVKKTNRVLGSIIKNMGLKPKWNGKKDRHINKHACTNVESNAEPNIEPMIKPIPSKKISSTKKIADLNLVFRHLSSF